MGDPILTRVFSACTLAPPAIPLTSTSSGALQESERLPTRVLFALYLSWEERAVMGAWSNGDLLAIATKGLGAKVHPVPALIDGGEW